MPERAEGPMSTNLELAAVAAYEAFSTVLAADEDDRVRGEMPRWYQIPESARVHWRAVADAVLMVASLDTGAAARERVVDAWQQFLQTAVGELPEPREAFAWAYMAGWAHDKWPAVRDIVPPPDVSRSAATIPNRQED